MSVTLSWQNEWIASCSSQKASYDFRGHWLWVTWHCCGNFWCLSALFPLGDPQEEVPCVWSSLRLSVCLIPQTEASSWACRARGWTGTTWDPPERRLPGWCLPVCDRRSSTWRRETFITSSFTWEKQLADYHSWRVTHRSALHAVSITALPCFSMQMTTNRPSAWICRWGQVLTCDWRRGRGAAWRPAAALWRSTVSCPQTAATARTPAPCSLCTEGSPYPAPPETSGSAPSSETPQTPSLPLHMQSGSTDPKHMLFKAIWV